MLLSVEDVRRSVSLFVFIVDFSAKHINLLIFVDFSCSASLRRRTISSSLEIDTDLGLLTGK